MLCEAATPLDGGQRSGGMMQEVGRKSTDLPPMVIGIGGAKEETVRHAEEEATPIVQIVFL